MSAALYIFLALLFLSLNAFFVLAEFAIVKIRYTRLTELAAQGNKNAAIAKTIVKDLEAYLATVQLGITVASLGLGWVGEPLVAHITAPFFAITGLTLSPAMSRIFSITLALLFTTGFHVVLGEQVPKNISIRIPEEATLLTARPLKMFHSIFYPPMWVLNGCTQFVLRALNIKQNVKETVHTDEELRMILGQSQEYGRISLGRLMMFEHLFDFGKTEVREIMTVLPNIAFLNPNSTWQETRDILKKRRFSRYPLLADEKDKHYYVHLKDLVSVLDAESFAPNDKPEFQDLKRPLYEINEDLTVEKALRLFQEKKLQLAIVRSKDGHISGLISMEDIVEELTGEIRDEFDRPPAITLSSIFHPETCMLNLKATEKEAAIRELLECLHKEYPKFNAEEAAKAVIKRENSFSTALGHHTAFPHARLADINKPILAVGKSEAGINFPSADKQPVKLIFLILIPYKEPAVQLTILKELSELILNKTLLKRLFTAKTPDAIMDIICTFEDKVME